MVRLNTNLHPHRRRRHDRARRRRAAAEIRRRASPPTARSTRRIAPSAWRASRRARGDPRLAAIDATLARVQNDLFDLGADLCAPPANGQADARLRVAPSQVERLERDIDALNAELEPLRSFVLPGGTQRRRGAASGARDLPARRAPHRRAGGDSRRSGRRAGALPISIGCRTICSSPRAPPTTAAAATCCGSPGAERTQGAAMTRDGLEDRDRRDQRHLDGRRSTSR